MDQSIWPNADYAYDRRASCSSPGAQPHHSETRPGRQQTMAKQIRLNAFDMNCIGHIQHGMWTHPRDRSASYNTLEYWQDLAHRGTRTVRRIFLADIVGVYDVYKDSPAPSILNTVQLPVNDPMLVVPVMAAVTKHIGFGVTSNLTYEPPYLFARRASTLDHLTSGRFGWNIVTGYLDSAARGMGLASQPDHDGRYEVADEYMDVVYKLWEGSWEDDAVLRGPCQSYLRRSVEGASDPAFWPPLSSRCDPPRRTVARNGRRCCTRPGRPRGAGNSRPGMPNACS